MTGRRDGYRAGDYTQLTTDMTDDQQPLYDLYALGRWAPAAT